MHYRQSHGTDAEAASSTDPSDRNLFPLVSEPPADDESALAAAGVLDESSDRPAELTDVWWRRLNEVTHPICLHKTVCYTHRVSFDVSPATNKTKGYHNQERLWQWHFQLSFCDKQNRKR